MDDHARIPAPASNALIGWSCYARYDAWRFS